MIYTWQEIAEVLGYLASAGVGISVLWKLIVWVRARVKGMFGIGQLQTDMEALAASMKYVVDELNPNGGTSIRDALTRIEGVVALTNEIQHARMLDSKDLLFRTDADGNCHWVNRTYARTVQRLPAELKGYGWVNTIAEDQRDSVTEKWQTAIKENREVEITFDFQTPAGVRIPAVVRSYKMADARGNVLGYLGSITLI